MWTTLHELDHMVGQHLFAYQASGMLGDDPVQSYCWYLWGTYGTPDFATLAFYYDGSEENPWQDEDHCYLEAIFDVRDATARQWSIASAVVPTHVTCESTGTLVFQCHDFGMAEIQFDYTLESAD